MSSVMDDKNLEKELFIDIDKVFKKKNPTLYKILPGFILRYLKRIIHQDEVNYIIETYKNLEGLEFVDGVLDYFKTNTSIVGEKNIPKEGRFIFVSNHPIGSIDGLLFIQQVGKFFGPTKSIINDLLLNILNLRPLFVGVNKHGANSKEAIEEMDNIFSSETQILIFPAGLASRRKKGQIVDLEWKKTFVTRAIKYKRDIVPVHITGQLSNFFYTFANLRKALRIKANLEMLYLADETFKQKNKKFVITFGKPISYERFDNSLTHYDWAQKVKEHVYKIKVDENIEF
jgi:1-acyl-sn-glycerol-3-phosphate acyltransferase